ncbi:hypothetical protein PROFUN_08700 [Planoprotostelium fungivorum]|uniref:Uncharacterized protein n=1 Tax=Planoprotostelium fungivorum TaxID=1890364 RepID=A0A2P6MQY1_9EUKA|nr:hypothetical protein PROFUN_08700 [Planoprotostelium fungivorum]
MAEQNDLTARITQEKEQLDQYYHVQCLCTPENIIQRSSPFLKSRCTNPNVGIRSTLRGPAAKAPAKKEKGPIETPSVKNVVYGQALDIDEYNWEHEMIRLSAPIPVMPRLGPEEMDRKREIFKAYNRGFEAETKMMQQTVVDFIKARDLAIKALPEQMRQAANTGFSDAERFVESYWDARSPDNDPTNILPREESNV